MAIVTNGLVGYWHYKWGFSLESRWGFSTPSWEGISYYTPDQDFLSLNIDGAIQNGNGVYFDGVDDKANLHRYGEDLINNIPLPSNESTVEIWIDAYGYDESEPGLKIFQPVISSRTVPYLDAPDYNLKGWPYDIDETTGMALTTGDSLPMPNLYHIVIVVHDDFSSSIFVNNEKVVDHGIYIDYNLHTPLPDGSLDDEIDTLAYRIMNRTEGVVKSSRLYDRALTDTEVQQNYENGTEVSFGSTYLFMDGVDDWIEPDTGNGHIVEMAVKIDSPGYIHAGSSNFKISIDSDDNTLEWDTSTIDRVEINGVEVQEGEVFNHFGEVINLKFGSYNTIRTIYSGSVFAYNDGRGSHIQGNIYRLRYLNRNGTTTSYYIMHTGTMVDQTGGGNTGTLNGGTWQTESSDEDSPIEITDLTEEHTNHSTTLSWTNPTDSDFSHIRILRDDVEIATDITDETYIDTNLTSNTTYEYQVIAVDIAGTESEALLISVTTNIIPSDSAYLHMDGIDDGIIISGPVYSRMVIDWVPFLKTDTSQQFFHVANFYWMNFRRSSDNYDTWESDVDVLVNGEEPTNDTLFVPNEEQSTIEIICRDNIEASYVTHLLHRGGSSYTEAYIYDIKLYDEDSNLVAHYDMSTGTIVDQTGNGNDATLMGGTWESGEEESPEDTTPPDEVSNLNETHTGTSAILTWDNPSNDDFSHVKIYRDDTLVVDNIIDTTYNDDELDSATTYTYKITTVDINDNESSGTEIVVTTEDIVPPGEVTNVSDNIEGTDITLTWENPTNEDFSHVKIYRDDTLIASDITNTTYYDGGLASATTYVYNIITVDNNDNESDGIEITIVTEDILPPNNIVDLSYNVEETSITLSWTNPTDIDFNHIKIYRNDSLIENNITTNTYYDTNLDSDTTYIYKITTVDANENESSGIEITTQTEDIIPPGDVMNISESHDHNSITLSWDNPTDADFSHVEIYRNNTLIESSIEDTTYSDKDLSSDVQYMYSVVAVDHDNNKSNGVDISATTDDIIPPNEVQQVNDSVDGVAITLTWDNPADEDFSHVKIYRDEVLLEDNLTDPTYSDNNLSSDTEYHYTITTVDYNDNESEGINLTTRTEDIVPPDEVSQLDTNVDGTTITLSWVNPNNSDFQHISIYRDGVLLETTTSEIYEDSNLSEKTTYDYTLISEDFNSNTSNGVSATVTTEDITPPGEVFNLATEKTHESITLHWENPADSDFSYVKIYKDDVLIEDNFTDTTFYDDGLDSDVTYTYRIITVDDSSNQSSGIDTTVTTDDIIPPDEVTQLTSSVDRVTITLTWENPSNEDFSHVNIYRDGTLIEDSFTNLMYQDDALSSDTTYVYTITTIDHDGNESSGVETTATTEDIIPPGEVSDVDYSVDGIDVTLTWTNPTDTDFNHVKLYRDGVLLETTDLETYQDTSLSEKTTYDYTFISEDMNNNESSGTTITITTEDITPPDEVTDITHDYTYESITLYWENPTNDDFSHVNLYRDNVLIKEDINSGTFHDSGLSRNTVYNYTITTVDTSDNESSGSTVSFETIDDIPADDVSNLRGNVEETTITLLWDNPTNDDFSHVNIYRNNSIIDSTTSDSLIDENLNESTEYTYQLTTEDTSGNESIGQSITFTTEDLTPPNEVTITNTSYTYDSVSLEWDNPIDSDFSHVDIYRDDMLLETGITVNSFQDTNLNRNTIYTYKLITVDTSQNESDGTEVEIETIDHVPPEEVQNINTEVSVTSITLTWENPTNEDFSHTTLLRDDVEIAANITDTTYTDNQLAASTTYQYTILTMDTSGNQSNGTVINVKTDHAVVETMELNVEKESPQITYSPVTISAITSGSSNPLYKFEIHKEGELVIVQDYSFNNTCTWTPIEEGEYSFSVHAKDEYSDSDYDIYQTYIYTIVDNTDEGSNDDMSDNTVGKLAKTGELFVQGEINERLPVIQKGLVAHYPFDATDKRYMPKNIRYIRDWLSGSTSNTGNHWLEIRAIDEDGINQALGKNIITNGGTTRINKVTDGTTNNNGYANAGSGYIYMQVDLGNVYAIDEVKVWHYYSDGRTYHKTKTEVSEDGIHWFSIFDSTIQGEYPETSNGTTHLLNNDNPLVQLNHNTNTTLTDHGIAVEKGTENLFTGEKLTYNSEVNTTINGEWETITSLEDGMHMFGRRYYVSLSDLTNDSLYSCSTTAYNPMNKNIRVHQGWCGAGHTTTEIKPHETRRISVTSSRSNYDYTYRFYEVDVDEEGDVVWIKDVQIEQNPFSTSYVDGVREGSGEVEIPVTNVGINDFSIIGEFIPNANSDTIENQNHFIKLISNNADNISLSTYNSRPYLNGNSFDSSGHNVHEDFNSLPYIPIKYVITREGNTTWWRLIGEDGQDVTWMMPQDPETDIGIEEFTLDAIKLSNGWSGIHRNLSIYDRKLSDKEIKKLINPSFSISKTGVIYSNAREDDALLLEGNESTTHHSMQHKNNTLKVGKITENVTL